MIDCLKYALIKNVLEDVCVIKACASIRAGCGMVWNSIVNVNPRNQL